MRFWYYSEECHTNWFYVELQPSGRLFELAGISYVQTDGVFDWYENASSSYHKTLKEAKDAAELAVSRNFT